MMVLRDLTIHEKVELAVNDVFSIQNHNPFMDQVSRPVSRLPVLVKFDPSTFEVDTSGLIALQETHEANVALSIRAILYGEAGKNGRVSYAKDWAEPDFSFHLQG